MGQKGAGFLVWREEGNGHVAVPVPWSKLWWSPGGVWEERERVAASWLEQIKISCFWMA